MQQHALLATNGVLETTIRPTVRLAAVAVVLQAFPELLGLAPWSVQFFVSFNLFWLAIWIPSALALGARRRAAFFPLWFLAIGCTASGGAPHPVFPAIHADRASLGVAAGRRHAESQQSD